MTDYNFKVGDKVLMGGKHGAMTVDEIEKITPTGRIKLKNSSTHYKQNGWQMGGDTWNRSMIQPLTQEHITELRRRTIVYRLNDFDWKELSLEKLQQVLQIVKGATP